MGEPNLASKRNWGGLRVPHWESSPPFLCSKRNICKSVPSPVGYPTGEVEAHTPPPLRAESQVCLPHWGASPVMESMQRHSRVGWATFQSTQPQIHTCAAHGLLGIAPGWLWTVHAHVASTVNQAAEPDQLQRSPESSLDFPRWVGKLAPPLAVAPMAPTMTAYRDCTPLLGRHSLTPDMIITTLLRIPPGSEKFYEMPIEQLAIS